MQNIIHASFANAGDGVEAAESLLAHGLRAEEISLILPETYSPKSDDSIATLFAVASGLDSHVSRRPAPTLSRHKAAPSNAHVPLPPHLPVLPAPDSPHYSGREAVMAPGRVGYTYDALGAVIPDSQPGKKSGVDPHAERTGTLLGTEEGLGVGIGLGLLTAMCVPGIGMAAGAGALVAGLMAAGAAVGGVGGGIYGWLIGRGLDHDTAHAMSNHLESGRATLSVSASDTEKQAKIAEITKEFNGRIIWPFHHHGD